MEAFATVQCDCRLCEKRFAKLLQSQPRYFGIKRMFEGYPTLTVSEMGQELREDHEVLDAAIKEFKLCPFCEGYSDDESGMWDDEYYGICEDYDISINWSAESA